MRKSTRTPSSDRAADEPKLEFGTDTPYDAYVGATTLHQMQTLLTSEPAEVPFLMISQIMELYFGLICHEWRRAISELRADNLPAATEVLIRSCSYLDGLNAAWKSLSWMTPREFNSFRGELGEGSGFQSAMYRQMEFLVGNKSRQMVAAHRSTPSVYDALIATLESPSLYDEVVAAMARRGHPIAAEVLDRDFSSPYERDDTVEAAWITVYRDESSLEIELGEALSDVAQRLGEWKFWHLAAVRRTMGAKPGTGGSSGIAWLERSLANAPFPELWTARTQV